MGPALRPYQPRDGVLGFYAGHTIRAEIVSIEQREADGAWHVVFEVDKGERTEVAHSAFAIFNGVFQAVRELVEVREPDVLVFATKKDELAGIYQTYLRRESSAM